MAYRTPHDANLFTVQNIAGNVSRKCQKLSTSEAFGFYSLYIKVTTENGYVVIETGAKQTQRVEHTFEARCCISCQKETSYGQITRLSGSDGTSPQ